MSAESVPAAEDLVGGAAGTPADVFVLFGVAGDLARRKTLPALYRLERQSQLPPLVIGVARRDWGDADLRALVRAAVDAAGEQVDEVVFERFAAKLRYVSADLGERGGYERLAAAVGACERPVFYLGTPPSLFAPVVRALAEVGLAQRARVVVEKPFGHDLASARTLGAQLHEHLDEHQIYRIDHFLAKPPVEDIVILRFWNTLLEPVWNRHHIEHVQITMAEALGVDQRGGFYDPVGALRDVVQNHLFNVLAIVAMEPPSGRDPDSFRNHVVDVLLSMPPAEPANYVRGQYDGYLDVEGVAPGSLTETYAALRVQIDNWRWAGVPFLIRAGKALAARATEVHVVFRLPPPLRFTGRLAEPPEPNELVLRIDPEPGSRLILQSRAPERRRLRTVSFDLPFAPDSEQLRDPYEALLAAVLIGNQRPFVREDAIEESWRVLQPLLDAAPPLHAYAPGSWGPSAADPLAAGSSGGWREPRAT